MSINDAIHPSINCSLSYSCYPNTYDFNPKNKNSIFNPLIDLFYNNSYYPSYFVKEDFKLNYSDIIKHEQYYRLDSTSNSVDELFNDLAKIVRDYRNNTLV